MKNKKLIKQYLKKVEMLNFVISELNGHKNGIATSVSIPKNIDEAITVAIVRKEVYESFLFALKLTQ